MHLSLPEPLRPLAVLAYNLRWIWNHETRQLFREVDPALWESTQRNPVALLRRVGRMRLAELAADQDFVRRVHEAEHYLADYLAAPGWFRQRHPEAGELKVAYFAAEFGLAECIPLYSGGLGILSGDHLKSSSELGIPLTGVGLLYRHGYFTQRITPEGVQVERYPLTDFTDLPLIRETAPDGRNLLVSLRFPDRDVFAEVWRAQVGRAPLLLLDTGIEENRPADQVITGALYAGDRETRLQQELVLGVGGLRALAALGVRPDVCHLNEGHAAFLVLERIRQLMLGEGLSFQQASERTREGNVFTTHTPVPAGFDTFEPELLRRYFEPYALELGISWRDFLALGGSDGTAPFSMVALALNQSARSNAVSRLHTEVSRALFKSFEPAQDAAAERLHTVTNGIHTRSWIAPEMKALFNRYLGHSWLQDPTEVELWKNVRTIPDDELWAVRGVRRAKLVEWVRQRLPEQLERRSVGPEAVSWTEGMLDPQALTIGWARRFTGYKRPLLLFRDLDRLRRLVADTDRPVQILVAGKAHPHDEEGKRQLGEIARLAADSGWRQRLVVLANYDIAVARMLVRGVDLWLNTPRRPLEASGTSGMKVVPNGGLNASVLDGWWAEAYTPEVGWAIGGTESFDDLAWQDHVQSQILYDLLEQEIVPLFYDRSGPEARAPSRAGGPGELTGPRRDGRGRAAARGSAGSEGRQANGVPAGWIARMKASIIQLCPIYNTNRMLCDYSERYYLPALDRRLASLAGSAPGGDVPAL